MCLLFSHFNCARFANIYIEELQKGTTSDLEGNYEVKEIKPGLYNVIFSFIGYESKSKAEVIVSSTKPTIINHGESIF